MLIVSDAVIQERVLYSEMELHTKGHVFLTLFNEEGAVPILGGASRERGRSKYYVFFITENKSELK